MSGYIGVVPLPQATQTRDVFTATSGQTSFATSGYTPNFLDVWLNGVKLVNGDDFTATNGSDVVLTSGAAAGDTVEVLSYSTYEVNAQTYTGGLTVNNDAATVLTVDRATSEGSIVDFKQDGVTVGSVGTYASLPYLASTTNSLLLSNKVMPATNTGGVADGVMDLGQSDRRFKDLYLSGGVYLGGTGAANLLDDYEEGTWTPSFEGSYGFTSGTISGAVGHYTKVGNLVHCVITFESFGSSEAVVTGDRFVIGGLPFTASDFSSSAIAGHVGVAHIYYTLGGGNNATGISTLSDTGQVWVIVNYTQGSVTYNHDVLISLTYHTPS